ncbi:MAG: thiol:disulfide interchange protein DsbA/DsbL [Steroidobacteraceae bacterium]
MALRSTRLFASMLFLALAPAVASAQQWVEGKHYYLVRPAQRTTVAPGKIEVAEAFSYGCIACDSFRAFESELKLRAGPDAQLVYVPASFNAAESWPLFQRAYLTAKALGIAERTHTAMYDAIWKSGELAVVDKKAGKVKSPQPTLEQVAAFYERAAGIPRQKFIDATKSFTTEASIKRAEQWLRACAIDQTPTFVVNGKYRVHTGSAGGLPQLFDVIEWLVQKEKSAVAR